MSHRRWIIALSAFVVLLAGTELTLRRWAGLKACVQVINEGDAAVDGLVIEYDGAKVPVGRLAVRQSTQVWLTASRKGPLRLDFRQNGNALKGFEVPVFDPTQNLQDFKRLVLIVKPNEIHRFVEDLDADKDIEPLKDRVKRWMSSEFEPAQ